ncbi:hypothetical protein PF001_g31230 [Phytophthora fragariae]|uniref:Uncharacterized protein n=1 Tax=Phytophthora fragariae TaxID=53985 RepID=A0A6A4AZX4_9STRA|nr:hypothetical protein PF003_g19764 [Phytophthora fragariae]KAE8896174.1 hypothetical protein PF003_g19765 [Phytophthora fragariae]KAE9158512.1 hypothetical protein PF004_g31855 [Phytophthora fragariae]KAE9264564.1 hypothetical protein PF001_g31230 [Phytophthora fragariae]
MTVALFCLVDVAAEHFTTQTPVYRGLISLFLGMGSAKRNLVKVSNSPPIMRNQSSQRNDCADR